MFEYLLEDDHNIEIIKLALKQSTKSQFPFLNIIVGEDKKDEIDKRYQEKENRNKNLMNQLKRYNNSRSNKRKKSKSRQYDNN